MALEGMSGGLAPPAESNVLQSFSDATAGRSMQLYQAVSLRTSAGVDHALTRDGGVSSPEKTSKTNGTETINFDATINKSTLVGGIGYLDLKIEATGVIGIVYATVGVYHWDGVSETLISNSPVTPNLVTVASITHKMPLTITKKNFRVGTTLRLKVALYSSGVPTPAHLYHDPQSAGDELNFWLPVVNLE